MKKGKSCIRGLLDRLAASAGIGAPFERAWDKFHEHRMGGFPEGGQTGRLYTLIIQPAASPCGWSRKFSGPLSKYNPACWTLCYNWAYLGSFKKIRIIFINRDADPQAAPDMGMDFDRLAESCGNGIMVCMHDAGFFLYNGGGVSVGRLERLKALITAEEVVTPGEARP